MTTLFDPVPVGTLLLPNRLAMAPMTRSRAFGGLATAVMADYYAQRADAGLIITEGIHPSPRGQGYVDTPGLHSTAQVHSWRVVTEAVHARGGRIFAQIAHCGRVGHPHLYPDGGLPVAPSAVASGGAVRLADGTLLDHPTPRALDEDGIGEVVAEFATAARRAVDAGFDGVELHGANGHLLHQFLADNSNTRTDEHGGPPVNRVRFPLRVVEAVTDAIGPERTGLRISPGNPYNGVVEADPIGVYSLLVRSLPADLAYLHLVETGDRQLTEHLRERWAGVLVLNPRSGRFPLYAGSFGSVEEAEAALGIADVVALGGLWLANPDLPERILAGGPYNSPDFTTFYGGDHRGLTDYATL